MKKKVVIPALAFAGALALATGGLTARLTAKADGNGGSFRFEPNSLVLSRSVYAGEPGTITVGQVTPPGCVPGTITLPLLPAVGGGTTTVKIKANSSSGCNTAAADGTYPNVFTNDTIDGSFGISSPIFLDNITTEGAVLSTLPIPSDEIVTSFSSKSELALHLSTDGKSITFVGYRGGQGFVTGPNQLDVSNSNTPGVVDPTNPVTSQYFRSVAEVDAFGNLMITEGNAYSGNNGRSAIKANGLYYLAGNDNNGGLNAAQLTATQVGVDLITSTGMELLVPGQTPAPAPPNVDKIGEFSVKDVGYKTADKPGKDNNFRGITIFNNTLYATKGSGGNGINTVYQIGQAGVLPTGSTSDLAKVPITILPGFPTTLASGVALDGSANNPVAFPFGLFFADANTLYVCDEGDGTLEPPDANGNVASPAAQATAGVQKWILTDGTWKMAYVLQDGLNIGVPYSVANYPAALSPATDGCRSITGKVNGDGTATIYAVTSTVSASGDQGADPNKLVKVRDLLRATTLPTEEGNAGSSGLGHFDTIRAAQSGEVLRGVTFAPTKSGNN